jgi:hypothetical protein
MIIRHSLKILEQLTEIETLMRELERIIDQEELPVDREKLLLGILKNREPRGPRQRKKR